MAPEQAVAIVAPCAWQWRSHSISPAKRPSSGAPGATLISGTQTMAGSSRDENTPSGAIHTPFEATKGARCDDSTRDNMSCGPGRPSTMTPQSRPAAWNRSWNP
jgi:hypothetical protein